MSPRLTDREVQRILDLHTKEKLSGPVIARRMDVTVTTVYSILWGKTHKRVTKGRNVSQGRQPTRERVEIIRRVYGETGSKSAAAEAAGITWQGVNYHLKKGDAA